MNFENCLKIFFWSNILMYLGKDLQWKLFYDEKYISGYTGIMEYSERH